MTQTPAQARQTIVTSDYPIDKVVYKDAFAGAVPQAFSMSDAVLFTFPHGLPFKPLCIGTYSEDNFKTSYEFGNSPYYFNATFGQYGQRIGAVVESDATNVYVHAISFDAARTLYFRVVGLLPSNYSVGASVNSTERANGLLFNSDDNYLKIYLQGVIDINDSGAFGLTNYPVTHNLGYIPNALFFTEWGGVVRNLGSENFIGVSGIDAFAWLTTTDAVMSVDPYFAGNLKLHYKVYLDA